MTHDKNIGALLDDGANAIGDRANFHSRSRFDSLALAAIESKLMPITGNDNLITTTT